MKVVPKGHGKLKLKGELVVMQKKKKKEIHANQKAVKKFVKVLYYESIIFHTKISIIF